MVDSLVSALALALREELSCPALLEIFDLLYGGLANKLQLSFHEFGYGRIQSYHQLEAGLGELQNRNLAFPATRYAVDAACRVWIELESSPAPPSRKQAQARFCERFCERIVEDHFVSRCRQNLMTKLGRSDPAQVEWEKELDALIKPAFGKLIEPLLTGKGPKSVRAQKAISTRQSWTLERLQEPLKVLR